MKEYELTVLMHPDLETEIEKSLGTVREIVAGAGGKIIKEDIWGKKKLAYNIKKQSFAIYVYMELELPASAPLKISNTLNITDEVLRYLLVSVDERARKADQASKDSDLKVEESKVKVQKTKGE